MVEDLELNKCEFVYTVKSRSSGLKSDGGSGREIGLVTELDRRSDGDTKVGT